LLDNARLPGTLAAPGVLLDYIYAFYDYFVVAGADLADPASLAVIFAGYHQHRIIALYVHPILLITMPYI
jgi:hypothetical protein